MLLILPSNKYHKIGRKKKKKKKKKKQTYREEEYTSTERDRFNSTISPKKLKYIKTKLDSVGFFKIGRKTNRR